MRCGIILASVLVLACVASAAVVCPGAPDVACEKFGELLVLEDPGANCPVESITANCSKLQSAKEEFTAAFDTWAEKDEEESCNENDLEDAAASVSRSLAKFWSSALGSVRCEGQGVMCGFTPSGVNDWAERLQEVLSLQASVFQTRSRVFCYGDLRLLAEELASEVAPTAADVCTTGGNAVDFEDRYQEAVQPSIELALKRAVAKKCKLDQEFRSTSACTTEIDGRTVKAGDVCGGSSDMEPCSGPGRRECCLPTFNKTFCLCQRCNGPWRRRSKVNDKLKIFADRNGVKCHCGKSVFSRRDQA